MHFKDMKWYMKALMGFLVFLLSPLLLLAIIAMLSCAIVIPLFEIPYYQMAPMISFLSSSPDETTISDISPSFALVTSRSKRVCWTTFPLP